MVVWLSVLWCAWIGLAPQQVPTFSSGVEAVRVDVLASRGGRPVMGLTAGDFEVRDDGVVQQIDYAAFEEIPLNVVLALDASISVAGDRADHLRAASRGLLNRLKPEEHAALVTFGDAVVVRSGLTRDFSSIGEALDLTVPFGNTSLVDASHTALLLGEVATRTGSCDCLQRRCRGVELSRRQRRPRHGEAIGCRRLRRGLEEPRSVSQGSH